MTDRLGPIKKTTNMGGVELPIGGFAREDKKRSKSEQLEETNRQLKELMPYLWNSAGRLLVLKGSSVYDDPAGSGFSVGAYFDENEIVLPVSSFTKKLKEKTRSEEGEEAGEDKFIRKPIVVLYKVGEDKYKDGSRGDKCFKGTRLVGETGCYDTEFAIQEGGRGDWRFEKGIGLKRRRRALGVAAAMLGRIEAAIASMEEDAYEPYPEETEPVSIEDVLDNTEMIQDTSGLFVPAESGWHTGSSCNKRRPVTLHSRPLEDL